LFSATGLALTQAAHWTSEGSATPAGTVSKWAGAETGGGVGVGAAVAMTDGEGLGVSVGVEVPVGLALGIPATGVRPPVEVA
jgi:hypothetical protein